MRVENNRLQNLLIELGFATFNAQAVEYALVSLLAAIAIRDGGELTSDTMRTVIGARSSKTMGKVLNEVTGALDISAERVQL